MGLAAAGGVGAAPLAHVLPDVDPAVVEAFLQKVGVVLAQDGQGLQHRLLGGLIGDDAVGVRHDGGVDIVHVELVHAQALLPQGHVAVHLVQVVVDGGDEIMVNLGRHLGGVQGGRQGALIAPGVGEELQGLELGVQGGGEGVLALVHPAVVGLEGGLAQGPVAAHQHGDVGGVRQGALPALAVHHGGEGQVGIPEGGADPVGGIRHLPGGGQQLLALGGEDVGLPAADLIEGALVAQQLRLRGVEEVEGVVVDGHDLRRCEGAGAEDGHIGAHGLAPEVLIGAVAGVLIALAAGIGVEAAQPLLDLVLEPEPEQQVLRAPAKLALEGGGPLRQGLQVLILFEPGFVRGVEVPQVPGLGLRHLAPQRDFLVFQKDLLLQRIFRFPTFL